MAHKRINTEWKSKRAKVFADIIHKNCVKGKQLQNLLPKLSLDLKSEVIQQIDKNQSVHQVTKTGNVEIVKEMLAFGVNPNSLNSEGLSPLHIACQKRYAEVVEELLENGANPNLKSTHKNKSPLHYAFENGYDDEGSEINKKTISIVNCLLKYSCEIDAQTDYGESPLYVASFMGNISAVKILLDNGAKIIFCNNDSALHAAVEFGSTEIIEALAKHNVDLNDKGTVDLTPLQLAAMVGQFASVKKLLECGVDVNSTSNPDVPSALHFACDMGHFEIVKLLLQFGAKTDFPGMDIESPIHKATKYHHLHVLKLLLKHGANVDVITAKGTTALHIATIDGNVAIVKELLKYGANVNARELNGDTVMHKAIMNFYSPYGSSLATMQVLLENENLDWNVRNGNNMTPLELAIIETRNLDLIRIIAKKMCPTPKISDSIYPLKHFL